MIVAAIREMVAKGFTMEHALVAAETFERLSVPVRSARQERNARHYQAKKEREASDKTLKTLKTLSDASDAIKTLQTPPLACAPAPAFSIGEEVSILPLEKPSVSIPTVTPSEDPTSSAVRTKRARASRLSSDSVISMAMLDAARSSGLSRPQAEAEFETMRDWSMSSPNGAKLDWLATWRGWLRRAAERPGNRPRAGPSLPPGRDCSNPRLQALIDVSRNAPSASDEFPTLDLSASA